MIPQTFVKVQKYSRRRASVDIRETNIIDATRVRFSEACGLRTKYLASSSASHQTRPVFIRDKARSRGFARAEAPLFIGMWTWPVNACG